MAFFACVRLALFLALSFSPCNVCHVLTPRSISNDLRLSAPERQHPQSGHFRISLLSTVPSTQRLTTSSLVNSDINCSQQTNNYAVFTLYPVVCGSMFSPQHRANADRNAMPATRRFAPFWLVPVALRPL